MKHTFKKVISLLLVVVMITSLLPAVFAASESAFTDVPENSWYAKYVNYVVGHDPQLMSGTDKNTFQPDTSTSRSMVAVVLYRLSKGTINGPATFTDLTEEWYKDAIAWAEQNTIVSGVGDNKFEPDRSVLREELVAMLWRYAGQPAATSDHLAAFPDANEISDYAKAAFNWAISKGIISGDTGSLYPHRNTTRGELAKMITVYAHTHVWADGICNYCGEKQPTGISGSNGSGTGPVDDGTFKFEVLSTTDMHGRSTWNDVATQAEVNNSMLRAATIIKQERAQYGDNLLLIDNGDTIQGTLVAQYAISKAADRENPMITLMKTLKYDAWVMGNHEFNYNPTQRDTQTKLAMDGGIAVISGNIVRTDAGTDVHGNDVAAGTSFYDPYVIKTLTDKDGHEVRIAIIGLSNANNANWDLENNYPGLQFSSLDNPTGDLAFEINKWTSKIVEEDLADVIIVSAHNGVGSVDHPSTESQVAYAIPKTHHVDLMVAGHDHSARIAELTDADGKTVPLVNGGGSTVTKTVFSVTFDSDGKVDEVKATSSEGLRLRNVAGDQEVSNLTEAWYTETYNWASAPLGTFGEGWNDLKSELEGKGNNELLYEQTSVMDLIHKAQIWSTWQNYESDGIAGATVSITSAVFKTNQNGLAFVPEDGKQASTLDMENFYRYANNLLMCVEITPYQLYQWMSCVADKYAIKADGSLKLTDSVYGVDCFYGVDYTFDISKDKGSRVVMAKIGDLDLTTLTEESQGTPIRVALNSYRLSGDYGFFDSTGISEQDVVWSASERLGEDRAPVPTQIGEYFAHKGTVNPTDAPEHGYASTWEVLSPTTFTILSTTDMHGKAWNKNLLNDTNINDGMLNVATAVKEIRAENANTILIDNGDTYEGQTISTYNIQKLTTGDTSDPNPMALAMKHIGYDISIPGNHEFNFAWKTMRGIYDYLESNDVTVLAGNLYYDGTNGTTAGSNAFDPYKIFTIDVDGEPFKIAVIGFENTDCPRWDVSDNYPSITFTHPDNPGVSLTYEIERYQNLIEEKEGGVDFTIVAMHVGVGRGTEPVYGTSSESQGQYVVEHTKGVDMFVMGHDHSSKNTTFKNLDGEDIIVVNAGQTTLTKSTFAVSKNEDNTWNVEVAANKNLALKNYAQDEELKALIEPYATDAQTYVNTPVGKITGEWDAPLSGKTSAYYLQRHDDMDTINRSSMFGGNRGLANKYATDDAKSALYAATGLDHITVDINTTSMNITRSGCSLKTETNSGNVTMKDIYSIYRYENSLYLLAMTGQEIKDIMEYVAENRLAVTVAEDGTATFKTKGDSYTNPLFYGLDFQYNMANEPGNRVEITGFNDGRAFELDKVYIIGINNYHLGNGPFSEYNSESENVIWSQLNDEGGGCIQNYMADLIGLNDTFERAPSNWKIVYEPAEMPDPVEA